MVLNCLRALLTPNTPFVYRDFKKNELIKFVEHELNRLRDERCILGKLLYEPRLI